MRKHVGSLQREFERVRSIRLFFVSAFWSSFGAFIKCQVFEVRELFMNIKRGADPRSQVHDLKDLVSIWINWDLRRLEVIVQWYWRSMNFFLLWPPTKSQISCNAHARLNKWHWLKLFKLTPSARLFGILIICFVLNTPFRHVFGTLCFIVCINIR